MGMNLHTMIRTFWPEVQNKFPGFAEPRIVQAQAIRRAAAMNHLDYMQDQIDQDPTAEYLIIEGNPKNGPCDRDTAVDMFYELMVEKMHMPSSFEDEYGVDHHTAADLEVLPRPFDPRQKYGNDQIFKKFEREYEQAMRQMFGIEEPEQGKKPEDDDDVIDMEFGDDGVAHIANDPNRRDIQVAAGNAVGKARPILYCVVVHPGIGQNELGWNPRRDVGHRHDGRRRLREGELRKDLSSVKGSMANALLRNNDELMSCRTKEDLLAALSGIFADEGIDTPASRRLISNVKRSGGIADAQYMVVNSRLAGSKLGTIREAEETKAQVLAKLISMTKEHSELWNALKDIEEKFNLNETEDYLDEAVPAKYEGRAFGKQGLRVRDNKLSPDEDFGRETFDDELANVRAQATDDQLDQLDFDDEVLDESLVGYWNFLGKE